MTDNFSLSRVVNLKNAEATIYLHTERGGEQGKVMWEVFPNNYSGNAPGVLYRVMQPWKQALETAVAMQVTAKNIADGVDRVTGTNYAPVMFYLQAAGEFGAMLRLVLSEEECLTLMHALTQVAEHATKLAPITVAVSLPKRQQRKG